MTYKEISNKFIFLLVLLLAAHGLLVFIVDPLQHYRKATSYMPSFSNQRYMNSGLAKNYDYDSVIIGASLSENFLPEEINKMFNINTLKLTMEGSSAYENNKILSVAIETKKVKNVFWEVSLPNFQGEITRLRNGEGSLPLYLYDKNLWNDYKYLLNIDILKKYGSKIFLGNVFGIRRYTVPVDRFQYWGDQFKSARKYLLREASSITLPNHVKHEYESNQDAALKELKESFNYNIKRIVATHDEISFYFIFPPVSALYWAEFIEEGSFERYLHFKQYIVKELERENVKIFDFQDEKTIIFDFSKYQDYAHYSPDINLYMMEAIKNDSHRISLANKDKKILNLREAIHHFESNLVLYNSEDF